MTETYLLLFHYEYCLLAHSHMIGPVEDQNRSDEEEESSNGIERLVVETNELVDER